MTAIIYHENGKSYAYDYVKLGHKIRYRKHTYIVAKEDLPGSCFGCECPEFCGIMACSRKVRPDKTSTILKLCQE